MAEKLSKTCEYCGKVFYKTTKNQSNKVFLALKYCSRDCYDKARGKSVVSEKVCECCGKVFTKRIDESSTAFAKRRFCSASCSNIVAKRKDRSWVYPKICAHCGKEFLPHDHESQTPFEKRKYCSAECGYAARRSNERYFKVCSVCGKTFEKRANEDVAAFNKRKYCSHACHSIDRRGKPGKGSRPKKEMERTKIYPFNIYVNYLK